MKWYEVILNSRAWIDFFTEIAKLGPLAGIFLIMIEAFIPILPLSVLVSINVMVFGFWQGYFLSWVGNVSASIILFLLIKKFNTKWLNKKIRENKRFDSTRGWIKHHGFAAIFTLLSFPFTPSFFICGLSALSGIKNSTFIGSIVFGKLIMLFSLSIIGYNITEFLKQPIKSILLIFATLCISFIAQVFIKKYEKRFE